MIMTRKRQNGYIKYIHFKSGCVKIIKKETQEATVIYLLTLSVFIASLNSICLNRAKITAKSEIFKFNLICSAIWFIILFSVNGFKIRFTEDVIIFGIIYGITQSSFILFKTLAMSTGPVSITTLIGNSSLLISLIVSLVVWGEKIGVFDIIGLLILGAGIFLTNYKKGEKSKSNKLWKYFAIFFFMLAAGVGITFKAFGKYADLSYAGDMLAVSSLVMILFYSVAFCITGFKKGGEELSKKQVLKFMSFAVVGGILSCIYNRLNVFLSGNLDAIIFFPVFNGGVIIVSTLLGLIICKEKLTKLQILGISLGVFAICIIGIL